MPSQRAILADITDKGLRPDKPHSTLGADGRLRPAVVTESVEPEPVTDLQSVVEEVPEAVAEVVEESKRKPKKKIPRRMPRNLPEEKL